MSKRFKDYLAKAKQRNAYWSERAILEFTIELSRLMHSQDVSKSELAKILNTSPAYVTKVFRGDANFTIDSMVKLCRALGGQLHIHVANENSTVRWFDIFENSRQKRSQDFFADFGSMQLAKSDDVNGKIAVSA